MGIAGYLDDEGRWCRTENGSETVTPPLSDRMCLVLSAFFEGVHPFHIYAIVSQRMTEKDDEAFENEVALLRAWLEAREARTHEK